MEIGVRSLNPNYFRRVLGNYPTGIVAVTATDNEGRPAGMTIGSFTSVSLDPPLVAFLPAKTSSTWPTIQAAGRFAANFLASDQESVCRALAIKGGDKFAGLTWRLGAHGSPLIEGAAGWVECDLDQVHEAGDHMIAIGRVIDLEAPLNVLPLLFFRGGYGKFTPHAPALLSA
jgi:3-hydroxy-9,10-secoandrosta-1,3,5(10)-triene-9,17-dione monooxygenase reductase component